MQLPVLILFLLLSVLSFSQCITKSFAQLNGGKYEAAHSSFQKILRNDHQNGAAQFGMARLYFMKDNSNYNLDSANAYVLKCDSAFAKARSRRE